MFVWIIVSRYWVAKCEVAAQTVEACEGKKGLLEQCEAHIHTFLRPRSAERDEWPSWT